MAAARGAGGRQTGGFRLLGTEFQPEKMESSGDGRWWWLHNIVNVLHATERHM